MENLNLNNSYYVITNTKNVFPHFYFDENNVPLGNSDLHCVSVHWATEDKGYNFPLSEQVEGFPKCYGASGSSIWNVDDPTTGVDVPVWTQTSTDIDCTDDEDCKSSCLSNNQIFVNAKRGKKCFGYNILKKICLTIKFDTLLNKFVYAGGCFENGSVYLMGEPETNSKYFFEDILFEVRNAEDPVIKAGAMSNYSYSFGASLNWLAILLNVLFFLALIAFLVAVGFVLYYRSTDKKEEQVVKDKLNEDNEVEEHAYNDNA